MTSTDIVIEPTAYMVALEKIAARDKQIAILAAQRATDVYNAWQLLLAEHPVDQSTGGPKWSDDRVAEVEFSTEIAMLTHRTGYRAGILADTSIRLSTSLPSSFTGFTAGAFSEEHANVIAKYADGLEGDSLTDYDERMARLAPKLTSKQLEYRARAEAETAQASTAVERIQKALTTRRVTVDPARDGMAYLTVFAPAPEIYAIGNRIMDLAKGLKAAGDPRSIGHLRVDTLTDLLLNGETSIPGATKGIRGRVHVTVPVMTLLGVGTEPAILRGYGPLDPVTAARLTADATSWRRVLTDPITGRILRLSPTDYVPTKEMRDHATLVHPFCIFPGCDEDATHADLDHSTDFALNGHTTDDNLAPLSPKHHKVKHHTRWDVAQIDEALIWSSPAGFVYDFDPQGMMHPAPRSLFTTTAAENTETDEQPTEKSTEQPCPF